MCTGTASRLGWLARAIIVSSGMTEERREQLQFFGLVTAAGMILLLNFTGLWTTFYGIDTGALVAVLGGYRIFYNSISALLEKEISADLAICIAVIAALAAGQYLAAGEAMFIMMIGEAIEGFAASRTSKAIERFVEHMPRRARRLRPDGAEEEVDASSLAVDDLVVVRAGERIPADGVVADGVTSVDESTITGEPLPRDKALRDPVYAGTLNGNGLIRVRVTLAGSETTLARVAKLVQEAEENQAPVVRLADQYARYFLPLLLLAGALTWYFTRDWSRTVAVLISACPCALILATPTAMVAAIGGLARRGILVRSGEALQRAAECDAVLWDKTGTITEGRFEVLKTITPDGHDESLFRVAAAVEQGSSHPLAQVIVEEARRRDITPFVVAEATALPGRGMQAGLRSQTLRVGNAALMADAGVSGYEPMLDEADRLGATAVLVAEDQRLLGAILLRDRLRPGVRQAVAELSESGLKYQVMLTGDRRRAAEAMAREAGIPQVEAELLPEDKLRRVQAFASEGRKVAMVGEGVNDAPALAAAHVGIAVHGAADISADAAGIVYLGANLEKLPKVFEVSKQAMQVAWQNIFIFALVLNLVAVWLCATGVLPPLGGALTHQLSSLFAMLNALRLLRVEGGESVWAWATGWVRRQTWWPAWLRIPALPSISWPSLRVDWRRWLTWLAANGRLAAKLAAAALVLNGFYILEPHEVGVVERFGRKLLPHDTAGLHYKLPWPIDKLTRLDARRVRVVEIGFRSSAAGVEVEPAAYEWNVQHRAGRFQRKTEESMVLSGDQNMLEMNATVHYRITQPDEYLFNHQEAETTIRTAAEGALQAVLTSTALDDLLTTGRRAVEERVAAQLKSTLAKYRTGVEVLAVRLLDVHPSFEVVDAFRKVSEAFELKNQKINEAEGYRNEQVAKARGEAEARLLEAQGYSAGRKNRSAGDADRFVNWESSYRAAPGPNETRLYLETMEQVLPGRRKVIIDAGKGRRNLLLMEDGVEIGPATLPLVAPRRNPDEGEQ